MSFFFNECVRDVSLHASQVLPYVLQSNRENRGHQRYFWNVIVLQGTSQSGVRKLNRKQERSLAPDYMELWDLR